MTHHSHVQEAAIVLVDNDTCVHLLVELARQCPTDPAYVVNGLPACPGHLSVVVDQQHQLGRPDVVVRRWP